jgi:hypothetical protein
VDSQQNIAGLGRRLEGLGERLSAFITGSEDVFLRTGAQLHGLEQQAQRLIEQSSRAAQRGVREGDGNPCRELEREIGLLDRHLARSRSISSRGIEVMEIVWKHTNELLCLADSFCAIVLTLRALASSTQIENSRTGLNGGGFDTVVTDVRRMTTVIVPNFDAVLVQANQVKKTVTLALPSARKFLDQHGKESTRMRDEASMCLDALLSSATLAETLTHKAGCYSGEVAQKIAGVMVSLQVHDLSRQMIEHVADGLAEFRADAAQAVQDGSVTLDERAWMAELADVCELEMAQLGAARDKLVHGLRQIDENLRGVSRPAEELARQSSVLAGDKRGGSLLNRVERSIGNAVQSLRDYLAQERRMMESVSSVVTAVTSMEALITEISRIGADAKVVGLNAMVKACNAGRDGHTLTVLAKAIQDVSENIALQSKEAAGLMTAIREAATGLFGGADNDAAMSGEEGESIAAGLERSLSALRAYHGELSSSVDSLRLGSATLSSEVGEIARQLGEMIGRADMLRSVEHELRGVRELAERLAGDLPSSRRPKRKHSAAQLYTMEFERQVHQGTLSNSLQGATNDSSQSTDRHVAPGEVELF